MRLLKVRLQGIRRFESTDALLVADRLVAVVGPNEAGKTSLLEALRQIDPRALELPSTIATRQCSTPPRIEALFSLDEADREALSDVHDAANLTRFWIVRTTSKTGWKLEQEPKRDLSARRMAVASLKAIEDDPLIHQAQGEADHPLTVDSWEAALSWAQSDADTLKPENRAAFAELAEGLGAVAAHEEEAEEEEDELPDGSGEDDRARTREARTRWSEARAKAGQALLHLAATEEKPAPRRQAIDVLRTRLPTIVEFEEEDRDLKSEYDLREIEESTPPALSNIAALADLDLEPLREAIESGDHGTVKLLCENANRRLELIFEESYGQSDVALQLHTDGSLVRLLVRAEGGEDFVELSERSAGFQWFVALVAFLAQRQYDRPLVLIDEIETHLHYGAQADVIDVLMRQKIAEQVIYTTHSAGALPPDLGRGVRAVVPVEGRQRSEIDNSFWTSGPGFTPLLFGLGASALAFSIPRHLMIAEGASDAVLLPTMLREATDEDELAYRIAPGIANTPPEALQQLDEEAGRVAYLIDGDDGGKRHRTNLVDAGIDESRILDLGQIADAAITPEDLVAEDVYLDAVNLEVEPFSKAEAVQTSDLPWPGRAKAVEKWCRDRGFDPPSKVRVAQNLVEQSWGAVADEDPGANNKRLCSDEGLKWLRALHTSATAAMQIADQGS